MPRRSKRAGRQQFSKPVKIEVGILTADPKVEIKDGLQAHFGEDSVSISLRYYQSRCECFSDWEKPELKKFSATIKKISGYTADVLKKTDSLCGPQRLSRNACVIGVGWPGEV